MWIWPWRVSEGLRNPPRVRLPPMVRLATRWRTQWIRRAAGKGFENRTNTENIIYSKSDLADWNQLSWLPATKTERAHLQDSNKAQSLIISFPNVQTHILKFIQHIKNQENLNSKIYTIVKLHKLYTKSQICCMSKNFNYYNVKNFNNVICLQEAHNLGLEIE